MIRRSPAEVYLQYLILHPRKYTDAQIVEICQFAQIDHLGEWYLRRLRAALVPPKPFFPLDRNHHPSRNFLLRNKLAQIFDPDDASRKAFRILELPRVKEFVEAMSISNAPAAAIAYAVTRQHRFTCDALTIERFRAFFWDMHVLDSSELRALIQLRFDRLEDSTDAEIKKQFGAMKKAYYSDSRKSAADLPFSPLSALLSQMKMGIMPSNLDVAMVVSSAKKFAAIRTAESLLNNGRNDSGNALNFAIVTEKMAAVEKDMAKPDEDLQKQLSSIALRTSEDAIPTIHALTSGGGSFTTDTGPMEVENGRSGDEEDGGDGEFGEGDPSGPG